MKNIGFSKYILLTLEILGATKSSRKILKFQCRIYIVSVIVLTSLRLNFVIREWEDKTLVANSVVYSAATLGVTYTVFKLMKKTEFINFVKNIDSKAGKRYCDYKG